jgi:hypothetical protein
MKRHTSWNLRSCIGAAAMAAAMMAWSTASAQEAAASGAAASDQDNTGIAEIIAAVGCRY